MTLIHSKQPHHVGIVLLVVLYQASLIHGFLPRLSSLVVQTRSSSSSTTLTPRWMMGGRNNGMPYDPFQDDEWIPDYMPPVTRNGLGPSNWPPQQMRRRRMSPQDQTRPGGWPPLRDQDRFQQQQQYQQYQQEQQYHNSMGGANGWPQPPQRGQGPGPRGWPPQQQGGGGDYFQPYSTGGGPATGGTWQTGVINPINKKKFDADQQYPQQSNQPPFRQEEYRRGPPENFIDARPINARPQYNNGQPPGPPRDAGFHSPRNFMNHHMRPDQQYGPPPNGAWPRDDDRIIDLPPINTPPQNNRFRPESGGVQSPRNFQSMRPEQRQQPYPPQNQQPNPQNQAEWQRQQQQAEWQRQQQQQQQQPPYDPFANNRSNQYRRPGTNGFQAPQQQQGQQQGQQQNSQQQGQQQNPQNFQGQQQQQRQQYPPGQRPQQPQQNRPGQPQQGQPQQNRPGQMPQQPRQQQQQAPPGVQRNRPGPQQRPQQPYPPGPQQQQPFQQYPPGQQQQQFQQPYPPGQQFQQYPPGQQQQYQPGQQQMYPPGQYQQYPPGNGNWGSVNMRSQPPGQPIDVGGWQSPQHFISRRTDKDDRNGGDWSPPQSYITMRQQQQFSQEEDEFYECEPLGPGGGDGEDFDCQPPKAKSKVDATAKQQGFKGQTMSKQHDVFIDMPGPNNEDALSDDKNTTQTNSKNSTNSTRVVITDPIVRLGERIIPDEHVFYKTDYSAAFCHSLNPLVPEGHVLCVSRRVTHSLRALTDDEYTDLCSLVQRVKTVLEQEYGAGSLNVATQWGNPIVVPHVHVHVLPRSTGDFARQDDVYVRLANWFPGGGDTSIPVAQKVAETAATFRDRMSRNLR